MARLDSIPLSERKMMIELDCSGFEGRNPFVATKPLNERRVSLVSTAALNLRDDAVYQRGATDYRVIPGNVDPGDVVMSHVSVNFDRTGFQQDLNVVFPLDRLNELADEGVIGSVAGFHYSFMGATDPREMEPTVRHLAGLLKDDAVNAVLLVPV